MKREASPLEHSHTKRKLCDEEMLDPQLYIGDAPPDCMDSADVTLILWDKKRARVHGALLALHSKVLSTLLSHLNSSEGSGKRPFEVPLPELTGEQALEVLKVLYSKQLAFTDSRSAEWTAKFAHAYDASFLQQKADDYLAERLFHCKEGQASLRVGNTHNALMWAAVAEERDLPRLSAHCERYIAINWEQVSKSAELLDKLSSAARNRITTGVFQALQKLKDRHANVVPGANVEYPSVEDFMSWRTPPGGAAKAAGPP